jgi:hypothetical protein
MIQADHLQRFGFPEFTDEFIVGLKKKFHATAAWLVAILIGIRSLDGAQQYDKNLMEHQAERVHDPTLQEPAYTTWEDDQYIIDR